MSNHVLNIKSIQMVNSFLFEETYHCSKERNQIISLQPISDQANTKIYSSTW